MSFELGVWTEDDGDVKGVVEGTDNSSLMFRLSSIDLTVRMVIDTDGQRLLRLTGRAREPQLEWRLIGQMRIKIRSTDAGPEQVTAADVAHLSNGQHLSIKLDNVAVVQMKLEFKWTHFSRSYLPDFSMGDTRLRFADGSVLRVHRALLAAFSPHMRNCLAGMIPDAVVDMGTTSAIAFKELLYHIYPTSRPVDVHFDLLATTAVAFQVDAVVHKCGEYLLYTDRPLDEKLITAVRCQLFDCLATIAAHAQCSGQWQLLISRGFDPMLKLGSAVYRNVVCPAIVQAQSGGRFDWMQMPTRYSMPVEDEFTSVVVVQGSRFVVNSGLLSVHGREMFGRGDHGELIVRVDMETTRWAAEAGSSVAAVFERLVQHLQPNKGPIDPAVARPMLLLAHNHRMHHVVADIQEVLIAQEPTTVEALLQALMDADRFSLDNLRRACLLRIETAWSSKGAQLVEQLKSMRHVDETTKQTVVDRLCCGWALCDRRLQTHAGDQTSFAKVDGAGDNLHSFHEITSEKAFGRLVG